MTIKINDKNNIYQELIQNQRKGLNNDKQLDLSDLKRISNYLGTSIFGDKCSLWTGYVTNFKNKGSYINFFFKGKKISLSRLLYYNFVDNIEDNEYLKYSCNNKGKCCCLNHIVKSNSEKAEPIKDDNITTSESCIEDKKQKKNIVIGF
jgi:hypothetical protein